LGLILMWKITKKYKQAISHYNLWLSLKLNIALGVLSSGI
jgi:hypothetical protein